VSGNPYYVFRVGAAYIHRSGNGWIIIFETKKLTAESARLAEKRWIRIENLCVLSGEKNFKS
jgi:hypothetical protein